MIQFEQRAVAFIDVIGFKPLVGKATHNPSDLFELNQLVTLLQGVIPYLDGAVDKTIPQPLIPLHLYISDCIILSAPTTITTPSVPDYNGLDILIMRVIQVAQHLLDRGYLLRGGIDVGPVWHAGTNIVGPAYQCAYALEGQADCPRVLLSEAATTLWKSTSQRFGNQMCIDYDGKLMVHALHSYYTPSHYQGNISAARRRYHDVILKNLNKPLDTKSRGKWEWFERYLTQTPP